MNIMSLALPTLPRRTRSLAVPRLTVALALLAPRAVAAAVPAHQQITNYAGAQSCTVCHADAARQMMATAHWTWEHTNSLTGQRLGKNNVINNYCIAVPSNEPRCTSCHVGWGYSDKTFDFSDETKVDCLVCHDTTGEYKKFPAGSGYPVMGTPKEFPAGSGKIWPVVDLVRVAQNVGKSSRATCGACHFYGGGDDAVKHGDLDSTMAYPSRELDVHMGTNGLNFACAECHQTEEHRIPGTRYAKDHTDARMCENCHTAAPHQDSRPVLDLHTERVACQTCHIPAFARGGKSTKMFWDWSTAGVKGTNGQNIVIRNELGDPIYDTQKGSFVWERDVVPEYVWFNGGATYVTLDDEIQPGQVVLINRLHGSYADGKSKIFPVKRFAAVQPYDAGLGRLVVPNLFPNNASDSNAYWKAFNWTNAIASGMAYVGRPFSGQVGWVQSEMYWIQNHMVAPKERALGCGECHTASGGRLDFAALGYESNRVAFLQSEAPWKGANHAGRFLAGYQGPSSCTKCHAGKVEEVMDSVHYTWRTPNPKLAFPGGGSHGMIDRFCALVGSSAMVNFFADLGDHKGSSACGKCHIGDALPFPSPATGQYTQEQKDGLDCLICHAAPGHYDMNDDGRYDEQDAEATHRVLKTHPETGRRYWFQDRSVRAAESVGGPVQTGACLRCHEHGQAAPDYKRGTPYSPEHDEHAAAGMRCTACHTVQGHKIARGSRVTDMHGWELQHIEVDCANCHGAAPHPVWPDNPALKPYNEHAAFIACETCHIPYTSGASRRIWYSTYGVTNGPEAQIPLRDAATGVFEPYSVYGADYAARPVYRWFNGSVSMLAEPLHDASAWDFRVATRETPGAKIYPFRPIVNGMVMDRRGLGYDTNFNPQFTMAAAMEAMSGPMKQMGFMRPEGLNERERAVLAQFPNLLSFDKETYVKTGDVKRAVDVGLGRLGMLMSGQDGWSVPDSQLAAMGANFWSGDLLGLDLPNNPMDPTYNPNGDPTQPTGSFISLSHAINRRGLKCLDCHSTQSVLDFRALSYPPERAEHLQTLLSKVQFLISRPTAQGLYLRWSALPGRTYQIQATDNLAGGAWRAITPPKYGVSRWYEHTVPQSLISTNQQLFFRVVEVQP